MRLLKGTPLAFALESDVLAASLENDSRARLRINGNGSVQVSRAILAKLVRIRRDFVDRIVRLDIVLARRDGAFRLLHVASIVRFLIRSSGR